MTKTLFAPDSAPFTLYQTDLHAFDMLRWSLDKTYPAAIIRHVRGARCHSKDALLNEFSAAFQFPLHFGHNWDALWDMLNDLSWLRATRPRVGLLIADADQVLMHADDHALPFWKILSDLSEQRARIVLHVDSAQPVFEFRKDRFLEALKKAAIVPDENHD